MSIEFEAGVFIAKVRASGVHYPAEVHLLCDAYKALRASYEDQTACRKEYEEMCHSLIAERDELRAKVERLEKSAQSVAFDVRGVAMEMIDFAGGVGPMQRWGNRLRAALGDGAMQKEQAGG